MPGHKRAHPETSEHAKDKTRHQAVGEGVNQKEPAITVSQSEHGRGQPFPACRAHIKAMKAGVDPMPLVLRQPAQHTGNAVGQPVVVSRGMKDASQSREQSQGQEAAWKNTPETAKSNMT